MQRNTFKVQLASGLLGIFLSLGPISDASAGLPHAECAQLLRSGWFRFDSHITMPGGPKKGQLLAASTPSPALRVLQGHETNVFVDRVPENMYAVSNFITRSGAAIAWVPKSGPKKISLIREDETDGTWHLMLRLQFHRNNPVKFWPQNFDGLVNEAEELHDILIDFGAHRLKGEEKKKFGYFRGLRGRYALQSRMGSTAFKVRMVQKDQREIVEYAMTMPAWQKRELLAKFIERTVEINQGEMYHTVTNNCVTSFNILLETIGFSECHRLSRTDRIVHGVVNWIPGGLLWSLRKKGVTMSATPHAISL